MPDWYTTKIITHFENIALGKMRIFRQGHLRASTLEPVCAVSQTAVWSGQDGRQEG